MNETNLIVLYGKDGAGKTTTLHELIGLIVNNATAVQNLIASLPPYKNRPDLKVILPYRNGYIYVATGGDNVLRTSANVRFFKMNYARLSIYLYDTLSNSFKILNKKNCPKMVPFICISASRPALNTVQPLVDFGNRLNPRNSRVVWARKREKYNSLNDAQDLLGLVNDIWNNRMV